MRESSLTEGDVLLLCTDGVHGTISEERIAAVLGHPRWEVDAQAERLLDLALEAGGPDHATVIVARNADDPPKHRAKRWWASGRRSGVA